MRSSTFFLCVAIALVAAFFIGQVPDADARPGGGYDLGAEARASATARSPGGSSRSPASRRATGRDAAARSASIEVEPWSSRPSYAAPWSAPKAETYRPGGRGAVANAAPSGSFLSYFFWILVPAAALAVVAWGLALTRRKEQVAWESKRGEP